MYLTEEAARKKVCPKLILEFNMSTFDVSYRSCIASDCMMFRHSGLTRKGERVKNEYYCGLGGKP